MRSYLARERKEDPRITPLQIEGRRPYVIVLSQEIDVWGPVGHRRNTVAEAMLIRAESTHTTLVAEEGMGLNSIHEGCRGGLRHRIGLDYTVYAPSIRVVGGRFLCHSPPQNTHARVYISGHREVKPTEFHTADSIFALVTYACIFDIEFFSGWKICSDLHATEEATGSSNRPKLHNDGSELRASQAYRLILPSAGMKQGARNEVSK
ncbi:uncharacterized protein CIMG_03885 [Coccidioides immitis RS]|uniref:Uncharacterized protein n=1 Tax=Coccidioides immitis (strain RS) TaxID=246410 RepID=A0A0E1S311_COCIM|nr:uncharacterized protein CIMG_03885 [Coccidioides immitis RS]EAS32861.2 hypothetical protein CIMG_03885 [Coccidioides immitis RS]